MYCQQEAPRIVRSYAGDGTGDTVFVWSDGIREVICGESSERARSFHVITNWSTSTTTGYVATHHAVAITVTEPVEPPKEKEPQVVRPKYVPFKTNLRPVSMVKKRPEFHARSNPR